MAERFRPSPGLRAGKLRQVITVQRLVETKDPFGQNVQSWEDLISTRAQILTIGGYEQVDANQVTAQGTHTVRFRKDPGVEIDPTMRVIHEGKVFEIVQAKNVDYLNREVRLLCRELIGATP